MNGRILRVVDKGALMRVEVVTDTELALVSLVGRRAFQSLGLRPGSEVSVFFHPSAAHVFVAE